MSRILVVGTSGQLGKALCAAPLPPGFELAAVGRERIDLTDPESIRSGIAMAQPDLVINAAAYTAVDRAEQEPRLAYAVNATGAGLLAAAAAKSGAAIIHVSTDYVFDGEKPGAWVEDDPVGPLGIYGGSKLAGELAVAAANPDHAIVRTSWVFSATGSNFVRTMLRLGRERPELRIVDDQVGRPTAAEDLAEALIAAVPKLLERSGTGRVYHFSNGGAPVSWYGFAAAIFANAAVRPVLTPIATREYPTAARRPANSVLATDAFEHEFGHRPRDWPAALAQVMETLARTGEA